MTSQKTAATIASTAFYNQPIQLKEISGGEINQTWLVTEKGGSKTVLQKLNPRLNIAICKDVDIVLRQMSTLGWEVPLIIRAKNGQLVWRQDSQHASKTTHWRASSYIPSTESKTSQPSLHAFRSYGALLGKLHFSLAQIRHCPEHEIPHFHDTPYHMSRLKSVLPKLSGKTLGISKSALNAYESLPQLPFAKPQLIHGDPRTNNMLFRHGKPFTFIDWDTLMIGNPWLDLGDLVRSIVEKHIHKVNHQHISAIACSYRAAIFDSTDHQTFTQNSITAAQHLSLELAARYLYDIVDDMYWHWDTAKFQSRAESNLTRAQTQWQTYKKLSGLAKAGGHT